MSESSKDDFWADPVNVETVNSLKETIKCDPASFPKLTRDLKLMTSIRPADFNNVQKYWHSYAIKFPLWLTPYFSKIFAERPCARLNHTAGFGCKDAATGKCPATHLCLYCLKNGHGAFQYDKQGLDYVCAEMKSRVVEVTNLHRTFGFDRFMLDRLFESVVPSFSLPPALRSTASTASMQAAPTYTMESSDSLPAVRSDAWVSSMGKQTSRTLEPMKVDFPNLVEAAATRQSTRLSKAPTSATDLTRQTMQDAGGISPRRPSSPKTAQAARPGSAQLQDTTQNNSADNISFTGMFVCKARM